MTDRKLVDEIREIMEDIVPDYARTFAHVDADVDSLLKEVLYRCFSDADPSAPDGGIDEAVQAVEAVVLWFFLVGREHARRNYTAPAPKVSTSDIVPDDPSSLMESN